MYISKDIWYIGQRANDEHKADTYRRKIGTTDDIDTRRLTDFNSVNVGDGSCRWIRTNGESQLPKKTRTIYIIERDDSERPNRHLHCDVENIDRVDDQLLSAP